MTEKKKFNVLLWDFNSDMLEHYDVLPYLRDCYAERVKRNKSNNNPEFYEMCKIPETVDDFKEFIENESKYRYWSRCEYEMILHGWPVQKKDYKLDVHEQIMMNIDVIAEILFDEYSKKD